MTEAAKVFIVDDDPFFLQALELLIDAEEGFRIVGSAENGREALHKIERTQPDIVLMDIQMPIMNGIECIKQLKNDHPKLLIIILTTFNEEEYIVEGLAHGANGYLIKGMDITSLMNTIRDITQGHYILPVEVATKLAKFTLQQLSKEKKKLPDFIETSNSFTNKEYEVLKLLANRYSHKEIAHKLFISEGTLRNYLSVIYDKLGVKNRSEAITLLTKQEA